MHNFTHVYAHLRLRRHTIVLIIVHRLIARLLYLQLELHVGASAPILPNRQNHLLAVECVLDILKSLVDGVVVRLTNELLAAVAFCVGQFVIDQRCVVVESWGIIKNENGQKINI